MPPVSGAEARIHAVRHFNRFYTRQIGVLRSGLLDSPYSLTEVRVLFELAHHEGITATELCGELSLDAGYLSRMLRTFTKRGWINRKAAPSDARQSQLTLTAKGRAAFAPLDEHSSEQVKQILSGIAPESQAEMVRAMDVIEHALSPESSSKKNPYLLRTHQPGDMGWVVYRHGVLYWQEYGYDERFEALVAEIVAQFVQNFDPKHERCWVAERNGERLGTVFLVRKSATVAKLRLLLVEPCARGLGIGRRLVQECIQFAKQARYKKMVLWTQSELKAARGIYQQAGFKLAGEKQHDSWSRKGLVSETWELKL